MQRFSGPLTRLIMEKSRTRQDLLRASGQLHVNTLTNQISSTKLVCDKLPGHLINRVLENEAATVAVIGGWTPVVVGAASSDGRSEGLEEHQLPRWLNSFSPLTQRL